MRLAQGLALVMAKRREPEPELVLVMAKRLGLVPARAKRLALDRAQAMHSVSAQGQTHRVRVLMRAWSARRRRRSVAD